LSVLVASLYNVSEPTLTLNIGDTTIGSIALSGAGNWETFTTTFVAGSGSPDFLDLDADLNGNDFVASEISITPTPAPVPEASTMLAGALMLLPFGVGAIRSLRKERAA
jgi:hypothetical protein